MPVAAGGNRLARLLAAASFSVFLLVGPGAKGLGQSRAELSAPEAARVAAMARTRGLAPTTGEILRTPGEVEGVATAILKAVYGNALIDAELPLRIGRSGSTWVIEGTAPHQAVLGGAAILALNASDGAVLFLTHEK